MNKKNNRKKFWWEDRRHEEMPEYVKLGSVVFQIDDAISRGKITAKCLPATEAEYLAFKNLQTIPNKDYGKE